MEQRRIGDRTVGAIGLGGMPMSVREHNDEGLGILTIHAAVDDGVTLIDTADAYSIDEATFGHNEELVARALASYGAGSDEVLVATKGGHRRPGDGTWTKQGDAAYLRAGAALDGRRPGLQQHRQRVGACVAQPARAGSRQCQRQRGRRRRRSCHAPHQQSTTGRQHRDVACRCETSARSGPASSRTESGVVPRRRHGADRVIRDPGSGASRRCGRTGAGSDRGDESLRERVRAERRTIQTSFDERRCAALRAYQHRAL